MAITVVGSIAFDSVKTPFGERERMLGGAAVHFALAASFFEEVRVVGPVGDDFGERELEVLRKRGVEVSDIERIEGGKTFFWRGEYGWDLNSRETIDTQLGVFEGFDPKLSERSRSSDVLFLANIQPELRGPSVVVAKQGEYGAALVTNESFFALPAYPLENVIDPTGAGDTFAGAFVGYIAAHPAEELSDELLRRAMAHATVLASFNVEEFGTERVERLTGEEIVARMQELRAITQFSGDS